MNLLLTIILTCFTACAAVARQHAEIEVTYNYRHFHRTGKQRDASMRLLANSEYSKFYSPETEFVDSLESSPGGKEVYNQMKMAGFTSGNLKSVPSRKIPMYIFKSKENGETEVYDGSMLMMFTFNEPYEPQQWEITDSTATILGYDCIMAICDFRGRRWTAWFTPEIPLHDGPWKLCGLP